MRSRVAFALTVLMILSQTAALAAQLRTVSTIAVDKGRIADGALGADGRIYLCYPDGGYVAAYTTAGSTLQRIVREAGVTKTFRPTSIVIGADGLLQVFDEASREVLVISSDGNQQRSFALAYPVDGQPLALSRIGHLLLASDATLWTLLPDRGVLCRYDKKGAMDQQLDLASLLPYPAASYARAQWLADGTLLLLDYNQGAVLYRPPGTTAFRRLMLRSPQGIEAMPLAQDFAAVTSGQLLLLTTDGQHPALVLSPGRSGYTSAPVQLPTALQGQRLGCRGTGQTCIVWSRQGGIVCLCRLE